jgi:RimJ/RimL family protein N-acetyltransferase
MTNTPFIQTPRLRMRLFTGADRQAVVDMHNQALVRALLVDDYPLQEPQVAQQFIERSLGITHAHPGLGIWYTERLQPVDTQALQEAQAAVDSGDLAAGALDWFLQPRWQFCGWFNLVPMTHDPSKIEIGCRLLPQAWGGGLALEGGQALLHHAFGQLGRDEVWATCHPQHRSVHVVLHSLGFAARGLAEYWGAPAAWFCIEAPAWQRVQQMPLRERRRQAVQNAKHAAKQAQDSTSA